MNIVIRARIFISYRKEVVIIVEHFAGISCDKQREEIRFISLRR